MGKQWKCQWSMGIGFGGARHILLPQVSSTLLLRITDYGYGYGYGYDEVNFFLLSYFFYVSSRGRENLNVLSLISYFNFNRKL